MFIRIGTMFWLLLLVPVLANAQPRFPFFEPVTPPRSVQVMVHRGLATVAPENSAAAIEHCARDFCEWVELDLRLSRDGQHVVIHNATVDATTDGTGQVSDLTWEELQQLDAGSWFARRFAQTRLLSLSQGLAIAKGKVNLYLDCKEIDPERLVKEILAAEMQQQVIVYTTPALLTRIRELSHGTVAGMTKYRPTMPFENFIREVAPAAVEIDADEVTAELCQKFHIAGIKIQAKVLGPKWDTPEVWGNVIDAGVDWLQTDDPAGLRFFDVRRRIPHFPVKIAFHRGASRYAPENTLPAIREGARLGADFIEIDIRTTQDGHEVLMHDGSVNRTTAGRGAVRELTLTEVTALSAGTWFGKPFRKTRVPTFDEGLVALGDRSSVYLDAKEITPEGLIASIHKHHLEDRHVVYQSVEYCQRLKQQDPQVRTIPPLKRLADLPVVAASKPYGVDAAWLILSAEMIAECHRREIQVFSDALGPFETVENYRKAIKWGIDCIQTDHPLGVLRAIELSVQE